MNRKLGFTIGGIAAISLIAGILGALSFSSIENNFDPTSQTQSVGIGAFVTVEVFDQDGNLDYQWQGHNRLGDVTQTFLSICMSGIVSPENDCGSLLRTENMVVYVAEDPSLQQTTEVELVPTRSMTPPDCFNLVDFFGSLVPFVQDRCTGWSLEGVYDVPSFCPDDQKCGEIRNVGTTLGEDLGFLFNIVDLDSPVPVGNLDRVVITMDFEVPE